MAYVTNATVAEISGIAVGDLKTSLITIAESYIENLVNFDMDKGIDAEIQYFDIENLNDFYTNYDGMREFVLTKRPVTSVTYVKIDPYGTNSELIYNTEYFVNYGNSIVTIASTYALETGKKMLKIRYRWGFLTVPQDVQDYANWYCAMLQELQPSVAKNDNNVVLKEVEIGRYREAYDVTNLTIRTKYSSVLDGMRKVIEEKYRISE